VEKIPLKPISIPPADSKVIGFPAESVIGLAPGMVIANQTGILIGITAEW
jgi:hypothetical protein